MFFSAVILSPLFQYVSYILIKIGALILNFLSYSFAQLQHKSWKQFSVSKIVELNTFIHIQRSACNI